MVGEIHGVIDREQAWRMWKPYGERFDVSPEVDFQNLHPVEAAFIAYGACDGKAGGYIAYAIDQIRPSEDYWLDNLQTIIRDGKATDMLRELLEQAYEDQVKKEQILRERVLNQQPEFLKLLAKAAFALTQEGMFTSDELEAIEGRLWAPDGQPCIEFCPMASMRYARFWKEKGSLEYPPYTSGDAADLSTGLIWQSIETRHFKRKTHNKVHEHVHACIAGSEIYDVTREDGRRMPQATVVGHFAFEPTIKLIDDGDYSDVKNCELNEGWTDYITALLMQHEPDLGRPLGPRADGYFQWSERVRQLHMERPLIFREVTRAAMVEATREEPDAKREALARMHEVADRHFGMSEALNTVMKSEKTMLDVHAPVTSSERSYT